MLRKIVRGNLRCALVEELETRRLFCGTITPDPTPEPVASAAIVTRTLLESGGLFVNVDISSSSVASAPDVDIIVGGGPGAPGGHTRAIVIRD